MLCLGFIDHEIALNSQERDLLLFKLLKNSDGFCGLNLHLFSKSFFSESFLLITFANTFVISPSLNPYPFSVASVYIGGLTSLESSTFLFQIVVNRSFSPKWSRSFSFSLLLCLNSGDVCSRPCSSLISRISCISLLTRNA